MGYVREISKVIVPPLTGISGDALLRTPCGPRRADAIRIGDLIVTRDHGLQPVRLIWQRTISATDFVAVPKNAPVTLHPRAIGPMMPQRSVTLGPASQVLVPGYQVACDEALKGGLIEARRIAGTSDLGFFDRDAQDVPLFNFVFDKHEVIVASGLAVTSFLPSGRMIEQLEDTIGHDLLRRFPVLKKKTARAFPPVDYPLVKARDYIPNLA